MERERAGRQIAVLVLVVLVMLPAGNVPADEFGPWSVDPRSPVVEASANRPATNVPTSNPFHLAFRVWSDLLTRIDGPRCAHLPSCSIFAYQALRRHGMPLGVWLALDRLMRGAQSSILRTLPVVLTPAGMKYFDPLEKNLR